MNSVHIDVKQDILLNKSLEELTPLIEAGQTVYAHMGKLLDKRGTFFIWRSAPKCYHYEFEYLNLEVAWDSDDSESLAKSLESIDFANYSGPHPDIAEEMQMALTQSVWSNVDEDRYDMLLNERMETLKLMNSAPPSNCPF